MENETKQEVWRDYVDDRYYLYNVNYNDTLNDHKRLMQGCIDRNSLYPLSEEVYDWWEFPEEYELNEIERRMKRDDLYEEYEEAEDDIRQWLWDHDESTPIEDLLNNTGEFCYFYSTGIYLDCGWHEAFLAEPWQNESEEQAAEKICKLLGIEKGSKAADDIYLVCCQSNGGELRLYFQSELENLISGEQYDEGKNKKDWQTIHFKGDVAVAVYNPHEGSGDYAVVNIDCEFPFIRENLQISQLEHWSIEECFGMYANWCNDTDTPTFSYNKPKGKSSVKKSETLAKEVKFEQVFKAGKCSFDDVNIERHRDVYYTENLPFGNKCPHCGRMWYD